MCGVGGEETPEGVMCVGETTLLAFLKTGRGRWSPAVGYVMLCYIVRN